MISMKMHNAYKCKKTRKQKRRKRRKTCFIYMYDICVINICINKKYKTLTVKTIKPMPDFRIKHITSGTVQIRFVRNRLTSLGTNRGSLDHLKSTEIGISIATPLLVTLARMPCFFRAFLSIFLSLLVRTLK